MADVRGAVRSVRATIDEATDRPCRAADERGQLLLLTGLLLAVTFVALALLLNTAIYTENLATRSDGAPATDIIEHRENAREGFAGAIEHANRFNNSSETDLETALADGVTEWNDLMLRHEAVDGRVTDATLESGSIVWGTRIGQHGERAFTNANGEADWTVASDVSGTDRFRMNVTRTNLSVDEEGETFAVSFDSNDDTWTVTVSRTSDGRVRVARDSSECDVNGSHAEIDFVRGTVRNGTDTTGTACPALAFLDDIEGSYDIEYANADAVTGVYVLSIDENAITGNAPYVSSTIHEATISVTYETPTVRYVATVTATPHDPETVRRSEGSE